MPGAPRKLTTEAVLSYLREQEREGERVLTTSDVADEFDVTRTTAQSRLDELEEEGLVDSKVAGRAHVWWAVDEAEDSSEDKEAVDTPADELATGGGASAEGSLGEVVEGMNDLRESQAQVQRKMEELEASVARAQQDDEEQEAESEAAVRSAVHEEISEVRDEWFPLVQEMSVSLFLILIGTGFSFIVQSFSLGRTALLIAGLLLVGGMGWGAMALLDLFRKVTDVPSLGVGSDQKEA